MAKPQDIRGEAPEIKNLAFNVYLNDDRCPE